MSDEPLATLLDELHEYGVAHDADKPDRLDRLRNLEPDSARLLALLVRATGARALLELGTSNGYSTIWLADAAAANGGGVLTVDTDGARTELARGHIASVGLAGAVELRTEDAGDTLAHSAEGAWDFIFLDAERPFYAGYLPDLVRVLAPGGLLAVDNVVSHEHELTEFTALIEAEPALTQTVLLVGAGLRLAVKAR